MVDKHLQDRFSRSCTDAAFGYTAAATAAYAAFADQVLSFWTGALQPPEDRKDPAPTFPAFNAFFPVPQAAAPAMNNPFA